MPRFARPLSKKLQRDVQAALNANQAIRGASVGATTLTVTAATLPIVQGVVATLARTFDLSIESSRVHRLPAAGTVVYEAAIADALLPPDYAQ
jgi:hypothetical protein